jgi:hypothetical protein
MHKQAEVQMVSLFILVPIWFNLNKPKGPKAYKQPMCAQKDPNALAIMRVVQCRLQSSIEQ